MRTRQQNLDRLSEVLPRFRQRLTLLHEDAERAGSALILLMATAYAKPEFPADDLERLTEFMADCCDEPLEMLNECLPMFNGLWGTPAVEAMNRWAHKEADKQARIGSKRRRHTRR
jgi:hypothetical protein